MSQELPDNALRHSIKQPNFSHPLDSVETRLATLRAMFPCIGDLTLTTIATQSDNIRRAVHICHTHVQNPNLSSTKVIQKLVDNPREATREIRKNLERLGDQMCLIGPSATGPEAFDVLKNEEYEQLCVPIVIETSTRKAEWRSLMPSADVEPTISSSQISDATVLSPHASKDEVAKLISATRNAVAEAIAKARVNASGSLGGSSVFDHLRVEGPQGSVLIHPNSMKPQPQRQTTIVDPSGPDSLVSGTFELLSRVSPSSYLQRCQSDCQRTLKPTMQRVAAHIMPSTRQYNIVTLPLTLTLEGLPSQGTSTCQTISFEGEPTLKWLSSHPLQEQVSRMARSKAARLQSQALSAVVNGKLDSNKEEECAITAAVSGGDGPMMVATNNSKAVVDLLAYQLSAPAPNVPLPLPCSPATGVCPYWTYDERQQQDFHGLLADVQRKRQLQISSSLPNHYSYHSRRPTAIEGRNPHLRPATSAEAGPNTNQKPPMKALLSASVNLFDARSHAIYIEPARLWNSSQRDQSKPLKALYKYKGVYDTERNLGAANLLTVIKTMMREEERGRASVTNEPFAEGDQQKLCSGSGLADPLAKLKDPANLRTVLPILCDSLLGLDGGVLQDIGPTAMTIPGWGLGVLLVEGPRIKTLQIGQSDYEVPATNFSATGGGGPGYGPTIKSSQQPDRSLTGSQFVHKQKFHDPEYISTAIERAMNSNHRVPDGDVDIDTLPPQLRAALIVRGSQEAAHHKQMAALAPKVAAAPAAKNGSTSNLALRTATIACEKKDNFVFDIFSTVWSADDVKLLMKDLQEAKADEVRMGEALSAVKKGSKSVYEQSHRELKSNHFKICQRISDLTQQLSNAKKYCSSPAVREALASKSARDLSLPPRSVNAPDTEMKVSMSISSEANTEMSSPVAPSSDAATPQTSDSEFLRLKLRDVTIEFLPSRFYFFPHTDEDEAERHVALLKTLRQKEVDSIVAHNSNLVVARYKAHRAADAASQRDLARQTTEQHMRQRSGSMRASHNSRCASVGAYPKGGVSDTEVPPSTGGIISHSRGPSHVSALTVLSAMAGGQGMRKSSVGSAYGSFHQNRHDGPQQTSLSSRSPQRHNHSSPAEYGQPSSQLPRYGSTRDMRARSASNTHPIATGDVSPENYATPSRRSSLHNPIDHSESASLSAGVSGTGMVNVSATLEQDAMLALSSNAFTGSSNVSPSASAVRRVGYAQGTADSPPPTAMGHEARGQQHMKNGTSPSASASKHPRGPLPPPLTTVAEYLAQNDGLARNEANPPPRGYNRKPHSPIGAGGIDLNIIPGGSKGQRRIFASLDPARVPKNTKTGVINLGVSKLNVSSRFNISLASPVVVNGVRAPNILDISKLKVSIGDIDLRIAEMGNSGALYNGLITVLGPLLRLLIERQIRERGERRHCL